MSSTKKGSNYYFGLKAHIGVDTDSGLVHSLEITTAKVADGNMIDALIHGEEAIVLGDGLILGITVIWKHNDSRKNQSGYAIQTQER